MSSVSSAPTPFDGSSKASIGSSRTAVSLEQHKLPFKPRYKLDQDASVNLEESPVTKDLTQRFNSLSLTKKDSIPKLQFDKSQHNYESNWMPTILKDQWPDHEASLTHENIPGTSIEEGHTNEDDSILIHESIKDKLSTEEKMPEWKRVALQAKESKLEIQPKLKKIFEPLDPSETQHLQVSAADEKNENQQSTIDSSAFNTAFKLFGQHDSFTSNKLSQIIDNIQKSSIADKNALAQLIQEELEKSHSFEAAQLPEHEVDATMNRTEDYIKNADALFANLKMRGAPIINTPGATDLTSTSNSTSESLESSWEFQESKNFTRNDTNVDVSIESADEESEMVALQQQHQHQVKPAESHDQESSFDDSITNNSVEKTQEETAQFYNNTFPHLQPENKIITPRIKSNVHSGPFLIKPEDFEMKYDEDRQRWIADNQAVLKSFSENDENIAALDAINDLTILSKSGERVSSILKKKSVLQPKDMNSKAEVSFRLPNNQYSPQSSTDDTFDNKSRSRNINNNTTQFEVTNVSQIQDISFSESKRKLVNVLSTVQPSGDWEELKELNLDNLDLTNVNDFQRIVPRVMKVNLSNNKLRFVDGLPSAMKQIIVSNNLLDNLTSFSKFKQLRTLDISGNQFESLSGLAALTNLTTLVASGNNITSLNGILHLDSLMNIDLSGNQISGEVNLKSSDLISLQKLNLSDNKIQSIVGLERLSSLLSFKADDNKIESLKCESTHHKLKKLCLNSNLLKTFEANMFPHLRVLRIDGNHLQGDVTSLKKLSFLEELSCKCQNDPSFVQHIQQYVGDVRSLDLAGTTRFDLSAGYVYSNINYLALSAMNLSSIPSNFSEIFPNVKELNLNFNQITDVSALSKMNKLRNLYLVSNNISDLNMLVDALSGSRATIKKLDLRLNPLNRGYYPYVFSPHETDANQGKIQQNEIPDVSAIHLDSFDDIQSFSIHYKFLVHGVAQNESDWSNRDKEHLVNLKLDHSRQKTMESLFINRRNYQSIILRIMRKIVFFDGRLITQDDIIDAKIRVQELLA